MSDPVAVQAVLDDAAPPPVEREQLLRDCLPLLATYAWNGGMPLTPTAVGAEGETDIGSFLREFRVRHALACAVRFDPVLERIERRTSTSSQLVRAESRGAIRLRVWERGAGLTLACGTGACATAIGAMRRGLVERTVRVTLPGGPLQISWTAENRIVMTGPATEAFRGTFDPAAYGLAAGA